MPIFRCEHSHLRPLLCYDTPLEDAGVKYVGLDPLNFPLQLNIEVFSETAMECYHLISLHRAVGITSFAEAGKKSFSVELEASPLAT